MIPALQSLIIYTAKMDAMIAFYGTHFGYTAHHTPGDRIVELRPPPGGIILLLHAASKGQKQGQAQVKLAFTCADVSTFCDECRVNGLVFGAFHKADGYEFANTKDPSGNSVTVSGRLVRNT